LRQENMQRKHQMALVALFGITLITVSDLIAQAPADAPQAAPAPAGRAGRGGRGRGAAAATGAVAASGAIGRGGGGGGGSAYPSRPPADPAVVARGKALFDASCAKCHAADLRGTPTGINLVRSQLVLDDQNGELIGKVLQAAHDRGQVPKTDWTTSQVADVATFMHTFQNYRTIVMPPDTDSAILAVGNAKAGEAYFNAKCASCHSVTGDLKGIGSKYPEPKTLQNTFVSGGGGGGRGGGRGGAAAPAGDASSRRTVTVTVTMANGQKYEGRLISRDDFLVTLAEADGTERTIRRNGDIPKVEIHDPMKAHRDLLAVYTDDDIHNLTAYLVTVK
jgi:cytochrome c oxidase cbb3-type subunit 3